MREVQDALGMAPYPRYARGAVTARWGRALIISSASLGGIAQSEHADVHSPSAGVHRPADPYHCHQINIRFTLNGKLRECESDLSRAVNGADRRMDSELIEGTRDPGELSDDDYKEKLPAVMELLRSIDWVGA